MDLGRGLRLGGDQARNFNLDLGVSPINVEILSNFLGSYHNREDAIVLENGFRQGFRLCYEGNRSSYVARNLKSARLNPAGLKEKISNEVALGRFAGPFVRSPIPELRISPVGLVQKSDGGCRLITHLSHPDGDSVNDGISDDLSSVSYTSFDTVVTMIMSLGKGAELAKRDIKSAFRLLPISPLDFCLLGIKDEDGFIYFDKFLPMGCKISCSLFEKFATFLHWLVSCIADRATMDHYLDDFIFCGAKDTGVCHLLVETFTMVCAMISIPLAEEKSVDPVTKLIFLGYEVDTVDMSVRIPIHKIEELRQALHLMISLKKVSLRELQSLIGKLAFFGKAVRASRAFLRRFYDATANVQRAHHKIRITECIREDMKVWLLFLEKFNGLTFIPEDFWLTSASLKLFTDSAGAVGLGCGCFLGKEWTYFQWPEYWCKLGEVLRDITFLEMVPVLLAVFLWGRRLSNCKIQLYIDNEALVAVLNKQSAKSKRLMQLIRPFILLAMEYGIIFKATHISTHVNAIADAISRKQFVRFRNLAPEADEKPQAMPEPFLSLICNLSLRD